MKKIQKMRYLNAKQMAIKIHSLIEETTVKSKLMPGKNHIETLIVILDNYAKVPHNIEPVAQAFVTKYKKTLYSALTQKLTRHESYTNEKLQPLIVFLHNGGAPKKSDMQ